MIGALTFGAVVVGIVLLSFGLISPAFFDVLFALAMGNTASVLLRRIGASERVCILALLGAPLFFVGAQIAFPQIRLAPYLAVVLINGFVAYVFGRGLSAGRTPLIVQLIRTTASGPEGTRAFKRFVYRQGLIWTVFGIVTALCGLVAMVLPSTRSVLNPAISGLLVIQGLWFVLAHHYARARHKRPESWMGTVRHMSSPTTWNGLEI